MADSKDFISDDEMAQLEASDPQQSDFISDEDMAKMEADEGPSMGGAALREYSKKASLGFADEFGAAAGAMGTLAGKSESPVLDTAMSLASLTPQSLISGAISEGPIRDRLKSLYAAYEEALPEVRQQQAEETKADIEANPITAQAAGFAGAALPFIASGGGTAVASKALPQGASLMQKVVAGAQSGAATGLAQAPMAGALGAVQGIGETEDKTDLVDTGVNAALGGILGAGTNIIGGGLLGGLAPAVKATAGAISSSKPGQAIVDATKNLLPRYREAMERFRLNAQEGGDTSLSKENVKKVTNDVITKLENAGKELSEFHIKRIEDSAGKLKDIAQNISKTVSRGSEAEKQAIINAQLEQAKAVLDDIVSTGEQAGKGIGEMMRGAKGTTSALKDNLLSLEKAINENPYLAQSEEALNLVKQFRQAISEGGREVRIPMTTITTGVGQDVPTVRLVDALKGKTNLTVQEVEYLSQLPREELEAAIHKIFPQLEQRSISSQAIKKVGEEGSELLGFKTTKEMVGTVPGVLRETATAPEYLNTLSAVDDAIRKAGKDSPLGKSLSEYRRNLVSQGRSELLGEAKPMADALAEQYGAFKDVINNSNLGNKKELSDKLLAQLSSITSEPNSAMQLNRFNTLKETVSKIDPKLASRLEEVFMKLNQAKEAIPEGKDAKQIAGFLQEKLPEVQQSAAARLGKEEIFQPLERYAGKEAAEGLEQQALGEAKNIVTSKEVLKLTEPNIMLKDILDKGQMDPIAERYIRDFQKALDALPEGDAKNVIRDNPLLFDKFKAMQIDANRSGALSLDQQFLNLVGRVTGKIVGKASRAVGRVAEKAEQGFKATAGAMSASRYPSIQRVASDLERKGLKGAAEMVVDLTATPGSTRAVTSQFTASQIPALRKLLKDEEEENK